MLFFQIIYFLCFFLYLPVFTSFILFLFCFLLRNSRFLCAPLWCGQIFVPFSFYLLCYLIRHIVHRSCIYLLYYFVVDNSHILADDAHHSNNSENIFSIFLVETVIESGKADYIFKISVFQFEEIVYFLWSRTVFPSDTIQYTKLN